MGKVYIASRLENAENVRKLRDLLAARDISVTYDWTVHGPVRDQGTFRMAEVADAEIGGVIAADLLIGLLPGGRGTHCEIGGAITRGKRVLLCGPEELFGTTEATCAFYHHPNVMRYSWGTAQPDLEAVANIAQALLETVFR